ncbi:hypothetical protein ACI798_01955 [Geodermatophilus sp. SYSU D01045]
MTGVPALEPVVANVVGDATLFEPGRKLTTLGKWFLTRDGGTLVLAVPPGRPLEDVSTAVAHAVAWQGDRTLALLVPAAAVPSIAARIAFLATEVRLWAVADDLTTSSVAIPSVEEAVSEAQGRGLRREGTHDLGERSTWVTDLVDAADRHWALDPAHRGSYLAWHCAGRQVLKMMRQSGGVLVQAGVQYREPPADRPPFTEVLPGAPTSVQRARIEAAVATAVQDRLTGRDETHVEHQLQAALAATRLTGLGVTHFEREYPAWRGDGAPGFIDFLGLDPEGRFHVIETKIGSDPMLVFQALDYAVWVRAHAPAIRADLGWPAGDDSVVHLDLVVAPKTSRGRTRPAIGPYTAGQLTALTADVPWQVHVVDDASAAVPSLLSLPARTLPDVASGSIAAPITSTTRGGPSTR